MNETIVSKRRQAAKNNAMHKFKRSIYLVDKDLQYRLVRQFSVLALIAIALCAANLYIVLELAPIYPAGSDGRSTGLLEQSFYWLYGGATLLISLALFVSAALYISHRFAGPEIKIVRALQRLANRDTEINVTLRKTDNLKDIAAAVNGAAVAWQDSVKEVTSAVALLRRRSEVENSPELQSLVRDIESAVAQEPAQN
jgi:methyl-accepting chemotaxis protein